MPSSTLSSSSIATVNRVIYAAIEVCIKLFHRRSAWTYLRYADDAVSLTRSGRSRRSSSIEIVPRQIIISQSDSNISHNSKLDLDLPLHTSSLQITKS